MAWQTPRTWAVSELVSAANMNTYISNDLSALNTVFPQVSGANRYAAIMSGVSQTLTAANTAYVIAFGSVYYDPNSNLTTGSAAKYTVPVTGLYFVSASWEQNNATPGDRCATQITGQSSGLGTQWTSQGSGYTSQGIAGMIQCTAGQTIQATAKDLDHGSITVINGDFSIFLVSAQ